MNQCQRALIDVHGAREEALAYLLQHSKSMLVYVPQAIDKVEYKRVHSDTQNNVSMCTFVDATCTCNAFKLMQKKITCINKKERKHFVSFKKSISMPHNIHAT